MCRIYAEADFANSSSSGSSEQPLGILPHQIRGSLSQFSQMTLVGYSSNSCTACCSAVSIETLQSCMESEFYLILQNSFLAKLKALLILGMMCVWIYLYLIYITIKDKLVFSKSFHFMINVSN